MKKTKKIFSVLAIIMALAMFSGESFSVSCSPTPGSDFTVSSSCTFPNSVDGVDNGNLVVDSGTTLTINPGQTIAFNPGKSLIINGAIAISSTAQIKKTYLWMVDADVNGYPDNTVQYAQDTPPSNGRRRSALTSVNTCDSNVIVSYGSWGSCSVSCGGGTQSRTNVNQCGNNVGESQGCTGTNCASCGLPWGGSIGHGASVQAYSSSSVGCGQSCSSQTRTCSNGALSGSYSYSSCSVTPSPHTVCCSNVNPGCKSGLPAGTFRYAGGGGGCGSYPSCQLDGTLSGSDCNDCPCRTCCTSC